MSPEEILDRGRELAGRCAHGFAYQVEILEQDKVRPVPTCGLCEQGERLDFRVHTAPTIGEPAKAPEPKDEGGFPDAPMNTIIPWAFGPMCRPPRIPPVVPAPLPSEPGPKTGVADMPETPRNLKEGPPVRSFKNSFEEAKELSPEKQKRLQNMVDDLKAERIPSKDATLPNFAYTDDGCPTCGQHGMHVCTKDLERK